MGPVLMCPRCGRETVEVGLQCATRPAVPIRRCQHCWWQGEIRPATVVGEAAELLCQLSGGRGGSAAGVIKHWSEYGASYFTHAYRAAEGLEEQARVVAAAILLSKRFGAWAFDGGAWTPGESVTGAVQVLAARLDREAA